MTTVSCALIEEQGPAYALGALDSAEREALEAHAERCPACARELADLRQVAAQLALSVPQHEPPAALRGRILSLAKENVGAGQAPPAAPPRPPLSSIPRPIAATAGGASPAPTRRVPWLQWAGLAAALAALIWGAVLQTQLVATQRQLAETGSQLERLRGAYSTVVDVLASPNTRERELQAREGAPGARGKVWVDGETGRGMMMARDLPPLPEGQTYQVWLASGQGRVSGGFLRPYDNDVYYVVLQAPGPLTDYQSLGVTREPAGGSPGPTGPRIIGGEI